MPATHHALSVHHVGVQLLPTYGKVSALIGGAWPSQVVNGEVIGLAWEHGMVVGAAQDELEPGEELTLELTPSSP
eukprot:scaffold544155_cov23-Prasinocladus_malaysianus.AAC.1